MLDVHPPLLSGGISDIRYGNSQIVGRFTQNKEIAKVLAGCPTLLHCRRLKFTRITVSTSTGTPSHVYGSYCHCRTASTLA